MFIPSYFTVKQHNLPELESVVSTFVAKAVRVEVKRIGMKRTTGEESDSSESKRGDEDTILYYKYSVNI